MHYRQQVFNDHVLFRPAFSHAQKKTKVEW